MFRQFSEVNPTSRRCRLSAGSVMNHSPAGSSSYWRVCFFLALKVTIFLLSSFFQSSAGNQRDSATFAGSSTRVQLDPWHNKDDLAGKCNRISVLSNLLPIPHKKRARGFPRRVTVWFSLIFTAEPCPRVRQQNNDFKQSSRNGTNYWLVLQVLF